MTSERKSFLLHVARRLDAVDTELGFIEDAAATLDLPFEFGDARGQLRQFRLAVTKALQDA